MESAMCSKNIIFLSTGNPSYRSSQWVGHRELLFKARTNSAANDFQLSQAAGGAVKRLGAQKLQCLALTDRHSKQALSLPVGIVDQGV